MLSQQQIEIAAKLYKCRSTVQRLYPDWQEKLKPWMELLRRIESARDCDTLEAAKLVAEVSARENDAGSPMWAWAAAVELLEPSNQE